jgi:hypothetical protein
MFPPGPPGGMPMMPGMGMPSARPVAKPTKPVIRPVKKLQNFNWRRVLVLPAGTPGKKDNVWDTVTEIPLNQEEMEELFENKVNFLLLLKFSFRKRRLSPTQTQEK